MFDRSDTLSTSARQGRDFEMTRMLRKYTASTVENFHTCQIGKMPLLGKLKIYTLINTRSTCYVSSIGLRNLMIPRPFTFADTPIGQSLLKLDESQKTS
jgi:hypothetical protein